MARKFFGRLPASFSLSALRRNALKEQENNKPPKNFRAIFQVLQELDKQGTPASEEESEDE